MELNMNEPDHQHEVLSVGVHESSYLNEAATWAKFLAIVGFVGCGFLVILSFFAGTIFSMLGNMEGASLPAGMGAMLTAVYLCIALLYFFPCFYLFKFATKAREAIQMNNQQSLQESFRNIKSCFKFVGIITLIVLCLYGVALIAMVIGASMFS